MSGGIRDKGRCGPLLEGIVGPGSTGHLGGGVLRDPAETLGEGGHCFELQPGLARLGAPASGAAEAHLGSALRFFLP